MDSRFIILAGPAALLLALVGCGGGGATPSPEPTEPAPASAGDEEEAPSIVANMQSHFADIVAARNAVIRGDVAGTRAPLGRVAEARYGFDIPPDWHAWVSDMQQVAQESSEATDLGAAARAVAVLASTCADCHRTTLGGPAIPPNAEAPHPEPTTLQERMAQHGFGANQLWLGLTAPS